MMPRLRHLSACLCLAATLAVPAARAALFEDDEARRAILELRQRFEQQRQAVEQLRQTAEQQRQALEELKQRLAQQAQSAEAESQRQQEENAQLRRALLNLQNQIEGARAEAARGLGSNESLARDIAEMQRRQKDLAQGLDERLRRFEPAKVTVDGREFLAEPAEQREFEGALATFRRSDFPGAQAAFSDFIRRYPQSGYGASALYWLGNAQYAARDCRGAITNFRALLSQAADHGRAPEALLSVANCQVELKEGANARRTLEELVKTYPQSEAAGAARERLARMR